MMHNEIKRNRPSVTSRAVITVPYEMDIKYPVFEQDYPGPELAIFKLYIEGDVRIKMLDEVKYKQSPKEFCMMMPEAFSERYWMWQQTMMAPIAGGDDRFVIVITYSERADRRNPYDV